MPVVFIIRMFTLHEYSLLISDCCHGNIEIKTNITDLGTNIYSIEVKVK